MLAYLLQQLLNGLEIGAVYALIALGYTLVYGIIKLINFAYADIFMLGAYITVLTGTARWSAGNAPGGAAGVGRLLLAAAVSLTLCGFIGFAMEKLAYRPLRDKPRLNALITALGVSLFIENFCQLPWVFGKAPRPLPDFIPRRSFVMFRDDAGNTVHVSSTFLVILGTTALSLLVLWYIVQHTLTGKQMRAVSQNMTVARLMGINADRVISFTFIIGALLGGLSGLLFGMKYGKLTSPVMGFYPGLVAFISAVVGGIGSVTGAVAGGFLMGCMEVAGNSINSDFGKGFAFLLLITVLIVRPYGIFGSPDLEKV
jgi:branched-chain amino acid transport system permease protein